jgi:hypothetical protein
MSAPRISGLLALIGLLGVVAVVILGKVTADNYLLDAALVCLALAGVIFLAYVSSRLWSDFTHSA